MSDDAQVLACPGGEPVVLVPADDDWPARFSVWRDRLADALGETALAIEHIGSTSVPGLSAKPVIDIDVGVADVAQEGCYRPQIEHTGLLLAIREPHHRFFRPDVAAGAVREVHVHVVTHGSRWQRDDLAFRDYLRGHPERRAAYARLKERLVRRHRGERGAYTDAKTDFVRETVALAENSAPHGPRPGA